MSLHYTKVTFFSVGTTKYFFGGAYDTAKFFFWRVNILQKFEGLPLSKTWSSRHVKDSPQLTLKPESVVSVRLLSVFGCLREEEPDLTFCELDRRLA